MNREHAHDVGPAGGHTLITSDLLVVLEAISARLRTAAEGAPLAPADARSAAEICDAFVRFCRQNPDLLAIAAEKAWADRQTRQ